jgi:uncharacterized protein YoxC
MDKNINKNSTKNEILDAYSQLLEQLEKKEGQIPEKQQTAKIEKEVVAKAASAPTEMIIKGIADLKSNLASVLEKLEASMTTEYKKFENLQQAIAIESKNLEDLYALKVQANSFSALLMAQKENKEKFENEMLLSKSTFENEMLQSKTFFEKEMKEKQEAWKKEIEETEKLSKERKTETEKIRKREEEEYKYNLALERKKETDVYNEKMALAEKQMAERLTVFEKTMVEREAKVLSSEKELEELQQKATSFPNELEKAVKAAEKAIAINITTQFEFEKQLSQKQTEGDIKLKDQTIQTLNARIKELEQSIKELNAKVQNADTSVKDIAIKAIESSGKMKIFETVSKKEDRD